MHKLFSSFHTAVVWWKENGNYYCLFTDYCIYNIITFCVSVENNRSELHICSEYDQTWTHTPYILVYPSA